MQFCKDTPARAGGSTSCWLSATIFLCGIVVQSETVSYSDNTCEGHGACHVAESDEAWKEVRGSLLQVETQHESQSAVSEHRAIKIRAVSQLMPEAQSSDSLDSIKKTREVGSGVSRLEVVEIVHAIVLRTPTVFIVVLLLAMLVVCVMLLVAFHNRKRHDRQVPRLNAESRAIGEEGGMERVRSNGFHNATSLPPTEKVSSAPSNMQTLWSVGQLPKHKLTVASRYLCQGLVVPQGNECNLAVPFLPLIQCTEQDTVSLSVQDLDGNGVMRAEVLMSHSARATDPQPPFLMLFAGSRPTMPPLASCRFGDDKGSQMVFIYDRQEQIFAKIAKHFAHGYLLSATHGLQYHFVGDILHHSVVAMDEQNNAMAATSPVSLSFLHLNSFYKVRVASKVDAGLILCALFSMDFLERVGVKEIHS